MAPASPSPAAEPAFRWHWLGITLAGLLALAALVVLVDPLRHAAGDALRGDTTELRRSVDGLGAAGPLIILALCLVHPAEIVDAAAGFAYGLGPGLALVMSGWLLNGLLAYAIGGSLARPALHRLAGSERFERLEARVERGGAPLLLALRLIPILPFSIVSYACGAARVPLRRFAWTTVVGYLPITLIAVYLGSEVESLDLSDPLLIGGGIAFLGLLVAAHLSLRDRARPDSA